MRHTLVLPQYPTAIVVLKMLVIKIRESRFEQRQFKIVFKTSRDHLLIQDPSGLSVNISGIVSRKTAVQDILQGGGSQTEMTVLPSEKSAQREHAREDPERLSGVFTASH